jgi:hypothetical protein
MYQWAQNCDMSYSILERSGPLCDNESCEDITGPGTQNIAISMTQPGRTSIFVGVKFQRRWYKYVLDYA